MQSAVKSGCETTLPIRRKRTQTPKQRLGIRKKMLGMRKQTNKILTTINKIPKKRLGIEEQIMDKTTQTTGALVPTAPKRKETPAEQDQEQMNFVGEVDKCIRTLEQNDEALALVAKRDVTPATLTEGKALIAAYQASFTTREQMIGSITERTATVSSGWDGMKEAVTEFRDTVRLAFPKDKAAQQALGATGKVPQDQERFLILARACATTAKTPGRSEERRVGKECA